MNFFGTVVMTMDLLENKTFKLIGKFKKHIGLYRNTLILKHNDQFTF